MSHFCGIVVGGNIPSQLKKYDEGVSVPSYKTGDVSEEQKERFLNYYTREENLDPTLSFDEAYAIHGESWNGNCWVKNEQGQWEEWSTYNPDSKWDWYEVGGRWEGYFTLKDGTKSDQCRKRDIDIKAMMKETYDRSLEYYNTVASCFPDGKIPRVDLLWTDEEAWKEYNCPDSDAKRSIYHTRPALLALQKARNNRDLTENQRDHISSFGFDLEDFNDLTAEQYANKRAREAFTPYCIVVKGEWIQKGRMGWFGMSFEENDNWTETFLEIWDSIHGNSLVSLLDFHI